MTAGLMVVDAGLSVVIELAFFLAVGLGSRWFVAVCLLANLATNLSLHLALAFVSPDWWWPATAGMEAAVVVVEWLCLRVVTPAGRRRQLPWLVLAANAISFGAGLVLPR